MAQIAPAQAANIAPQFGAPQVQSPVAPRQVAAFPGALPGAPLNAPFAAGAHLAGAPFAGAAYAGGYAAYAPTAAAGLVHPGLAGAPALSALSTPYGALSPYTGAPAVYSGATPYPGGAIHPASGLVAPTLAGAVPAGFNNALVAAVGPHLVDDWSSAHGYGFPATYGYGALPAANATVALGGLGNLYDSRLVGTAAANPALYAASYGTPYGAAYGNYVAPSYVPTTVQGVPTYSALAGHAGVAAAANVYAPQYAATVQAGGLNAFAPGYFNSGAINTFAPTYFGGFAGQYGAPALY